MSGSGIQPLRIGVLGASRIGAKALVAPARELGHRLVSVAARDPERARAYAAEHGFERSVACYADVLADPEVEVVYNPLANGLHAPWNQRALAAGKHVLSEKPSAANATEAATVETVVAGSGLTFLEGFHYAFHPLFARILEITGSGEIGALREVTATMVMPAPADHDPRWQLALAGGAVMDIGCYALHAIRHLGRYAGGEPAVVSAAATERDGHPEVDERLNAELSYPDGTVAHAICDMAAERLEFSLTVTGSQGSVHAPSFVLPQDDPRLVVRTRGEDRVERLTDRPSFSFQLEALATHLRGSPALPLNALAQSLPDGVPLRLDATEARVQLELTDAAYRAAGLDPRPSSTL
jgi:predicted dehydrogenase